MCALRGAYRLAWKAGRLTHPHEETTLARAKNIRRSDARRRARASARAAVSEQDEQQAGIGDQDQPEQPRRQLFATPRLREDIRYLPTMFRERKLLWVPVIVLLVGFALTYVAYLGQLPAGLADMADLYIQFFFVPYGLFTFFIGGYLAPRASYLVGFLLGVLNGVLWSVLIFIGTSLPVQPDAPPQEPTAAAIQVVGIAVLYGTLAAAFAGWYRNFLRGMRERGQQRRQERELAERAKRRQERQEARRVSR
jgi:hypothetical protein